MKKKKGYKIFISLLAIVLVIIVATSEEDESYAAKNVEKRASLIEGINKINIETMALHQSRMERFNKLMKDLDEFKEKGSDGIDSDNLLYLTNKSGFTGPELEEGLKGTDLEGLGEDFKAAENRYGVNAILLMAMAKHESGNGTSLLANEKNNLFGFNAIDDDPINKASKFKTKGESIMYVARHLKYNYLDKNGIYYNGVSTDGIGQMYASDRAWSDKVEGMMIEVCQNMIDGYINAGE